MPDSSLDTARLDRCVERWQAGDPDAANELIRAATSRLERLVDDLLKRYPALRDEVEAKGVLDGCVVRLLEALRLIRPGNTRDFYILAAVHTRRELIELARHFASSETPAGSAEDLASWCRFHVEVDNLPHDQREVVNLIVYHGWKPEQIAELLGVDERTVRHRWRDATAKLSHALGGRLPGST